MKDCLKIQVPTDWYMSVDGLRPFNDTKWVLIELHSDGSVTWDPEVSSLKAADVVE